MTQRPFKVGDKVTLTFLKPTRVGRVCALPNDDKNRWLVQLDQTWFVGAFEEEMKLCVGS